MCSIVEPPNKYPVTDSCMKRSDGTSYYDARASWEGGPHWASNFRSYHPEGANIALCDGSVQFLTDMIDFSDDPANLGVYQKLSTMQGGEVISDY